MKDRETVEKQLYNKIKMFDEYQVDKYYWYIKALEWVLSDEEG